jgi:hypothetical protein
MQFRRARGNDAVSQRSNLDRRRQYAGLRKPECVA